MAYFIALGALGAALFSLIASIFFTAASAVSIAQFILGERHVTLGLQSGCSKQKATSGLPSLTWVGPA